MCIEGHTYPQQRLHLRLPSFIRLQDLLGSRLPDLRPRERRILLRRVGVEGDHVDEVFVAQVDGVGDDVLVLAAVLLK